jgi:hypothetical protein
VAVEQVLLETEQLTMDQEVQEDQEQPIQLQVHLSLTPGAAAQAAREDLEDHQEQTDSAEAEAEVLTHQDQEDLAETE